MFLQLRDITTVEVFEEILHTQKWVGLGIRGWRWVGLGVETGRFRGGDGWV